MSSSGSALHDASLGPLLVAITQRGVCAVEFVDEAGAPASLRKRFPNARLEAADPRDLRWIKDVVAAVDSPGPRADLPLDIRGTAFQTRVWRALAKIPLRPDVVVLRGCEANQVAQQHPRSRRGLRIKRAGGGRSLSSCCWQQRQAHRLPLGPGSQAGPAKKGRPGRRRKRRRVQALETGQLVF